MLYSLIGSTPTVSESVITSLTSAFTTIGTDMGSVLTAIVPIACTVLGAGMVLRFGVRWFQRITNKV